MGGLVQQVSDAGHRARSNPARPAGLARTRAVRSETLVDLQRDEALNRSAKVRNLTQLQQSFDHGARVAGQARVGAAMQMRCKGCAEEEEKRADSGTLQARAGGASSSTEGVAPANRTGLPDRLLSGIESLSGLSMADVAVHFDSEKPAQLQALAYTQGTDIHVAPGQERHLAHEAWHVVQQKQGRVAPNTQMKGIAVNDDATLEREADVMGARAAAAVQEPNETSREPASPASGNAVQLLRVRPQATVAHRRSVAAGAVVQARWVEGPDRLLKWEPTVQGYTWWFNQDDRTMAYTEAAAEMTSELAQTLVWKPHKTWQGEALERIDPDAGVAPRVSFEALVQKGTDRWRELSEAGPGQLDPVTQAARDWFFDEYYTTVPRTQDGTTDIRSNYSARPASYNVKRQKGEYTGEINTAEGRIVPNQTYALGGGGEVYYNPRTGNAERMSASEILFQQWRLAAREQEQVSPRLRVKEETVAGDGIPMLRTIRAGAHVPDRTDATFVPGDDGFLAMLAVPNVTAAIYLIRDHGRELGVRTITRIDVLKNSHIVIHFG